MLVGLLLAGMLAVVSLGVTSDVVKIPNSALRFFPQPKYVRQQDKPLVEGKGLDQIGFVARRVLPEEALPRCV